MNQMSCRGREHHLVLTKATAEEAGIVAFTAGNERTSARLRVQSKPKGENNKESDISSKVLLNIEHFFNRAK